ncbi:PAS domain S-box protein [Desulfovibrio mangrovi]|uniref:sensor domain-containing protein n=1 Tax=Desulfovibrio mangrovi TaxID=2976983 RepID=UPI002247A51D|nr:sensor domain-containing diguanylate cyclase [Desulfovibrio mangrovi]UZP66449.1 PAS domain S-box protein [Desulfovibrio mangrovi]
MHSRTCAILTGLPALLPSSAFSAVADSTAVSSPPAISSTLLTGIIILWVVSVLFAWRHGRKHATPQNEPEAAPSAEALITLRDELEAKDKACLKASLEAQELRSLIDLAQVAIFRSSLDGSRFLFINKSCAQLLGYDSAENLTSTTTPITLHADPAIRDAMMDVLDKHGRVDNLELEFVDKRGNIHQALVTATLHKEEGYIQGAVMDISESKEAERLLRNSHTFLQTLLNALPTAVFFKDAEARYQLLNKAFEELLGQKAEDLLGKSVFDIAPRHLAEKYHEMDKTLLESRGPAIQQYEYQVQGDGGLRDVIFNKESMFDENGNLLGLVGVIFDITDRKRIENSLRRAEERYRALYMNAAEGIFTATADGRFVGVNPAMSQMFGYDSPANMTYKVTDMGTQVFADPQQLEILKKRLVGEKVVNRFEAQVIRRDGQQFWVAISSRGIFGLGDRLERFEGLVMDITAQKRSEEELAMMVVTDPLTSIANRIGMGQQLETMLRQAERSDCQIGLLFIDLDGFKPINDSFGHQTGDFLLQQVAKRLSQRLRGSDVAARVGGDEFAVLLWDVAGPAAVERLSRELLATLLDPYDCKVTVCTIGASIGGSIYPHHGRTANELLSAADSAMYEAKREGSQFSFAPLPATKE